MQLINFSWYCLETLHMHLEWLFRKDFTEMVKWTICQK